MNTYEYLAGILEVEPSLFEFVDKYMSEKTGKSGVLEKVAEKNKESVNRALKFLQVSDKNKKNVREALKETIILHEKQLLESIDKLEGENEFEKAVHFAKLVTRPKTGFFLKKEKAEEIIIRRKPQSVISYLGYSGVDEMLKNHDVTEIFSSLRFLESDEWMHETFDEVYSEFTPEDFEERDIEVRVLGPEWKSVAEKFVAKKHHNVSHLKEFGVIFLNPIRMNIPGKFLRDTPLFLHYFHEIEFYAKLFRKSSKEDNFADALKSLLRGDVPETDTVDEGEWLIIQRYLWKVNPKDPRLFLPRVNPESMHWSRAEREVAFFGALEQSSDLEFWHDLDWVAELFNGESVNKGLVSMDLEDNAMMIASLMEGNYEPLFYHQREAMWTKIFEEYVGGEKNMEDLLIENFDKGVVQF